MHVKCTEAGDLKKLRWLNYSWLRWSGLASAGYRGLVVVHSQLTQNWFHRAWWNTWSYNPLSLAERVADSIFWSKLPPQALYIVQILLSPRITYLQYHTYHTFDLFQPNGLKTYLNHKCFESKAKSSRFWSLSKTIVAGKTKG